MVARPEELGVTLQVTTLLEELGVPYLVGGSIASSLLGVPRATLDVDLVADLRPKHVAPFVSRVEPDFYAEEGSIREAVRHRTSFNIIHLASMLKFDVFVAKDDALTREEMARRQRYPLPGDPPAELVLATAEDIIIQKLMWYRLGHGISDRQWHDVLGVPASRGPASI